MIGSYSSIDITMRDRMDLDPKQITYFTLCVTTAGVKCLCGGCKMSPRTSSLCSHIFLVLREH